VKTKLIALAAAAALVATGVAAASTSIAGVYLTSVSGKFPANLDGDWAIRFEPSGKYEIQKRVGNHGQLVVVGHAKIAGSRITFQKETGLAACTGKQSVGRYGWSLKGTTLRFVRFSDKCVGRRILLGGKLTKVQ
jgi:hypothetical protein